MIYIYYSAPYDLPDTFATPEYYEVKRRDPDCIRIFENSLTGELFMPDLKSFRLKSDSFSNSHYSLMIGLSENLLKNSTLVMSDVTDLSNRADEADCLYQRFIDRDILLEFLNSPWLNSENIRLLLSSNPYEARKLASLNLISTIKWKNGKIFDTAFTDPEITQQPNRIKKNGL